MAPSSTMESLDSTTEASSQVNKAISLTSSDPTLVRAWLSSHHPKQLALVDKFELELRLGRLSLSSSSSSRSGNNNTTTTNTASAIGSPHDNRLLITSLTVDLLRRVIGSTRWKNGAQLIYLLKGLGKELHAAGAFREPAIGNVIRRVICVVRDEVRNSNSSSNRGSAVANTAQLSLWSVLWAHPQQQVVKKSGGGGRREITSEEGEEENKTTTTTSSVDNTTTTNTEEFPSIFYSNQPELRASIMEAIQEISSDLEDVHSNINEQASAHVHEGEVLLTYGQSKTVELFLKAAAAKKRKFQVIVCEGAPHFSGHILSKSLASVGIDVVVIHDAATFAIMSRVNKVLLPAHAVLANGGLVSSSGSNMVALAAKENSVPVVCVTGMFKLCPMYPHEGQDTLNDLVSPSSVLDYASWSSVNSNNNNNNMLDVELINPMHDYIPPEQIDLFVTNIGGFQPGYIYRLLAEYYHSDDWESFE